MELRALNLHLLAELGTWVAQGDSSEALPKLEQYLESHPGIVFTLVTRGSLKQSLGRLEGLAKRLPVHLISDAGTAISHRGEQGAWVEDAEYRAWVESRWDPHALERFVVWATPIGSKRAIGGYSSRHVIFEFEPSVDPAQAIGKMETSMNNFGLSGTVEQLGQVLEVVPKGVSRVAAAMFLHRQLNHPGPLMVCGSTELNLDLFQKADYPVLMAKSPMGFDTPGIPAERIYLTASNGPAGILEALMRVEYDNPYEPNKERP